LPNLVSVFEVVKVKILELYIITVLILFLRLIELIYLDSNYQISVFVYIT
jgi:hypothetical protein